MKRYFYFGCCLLSLLLLTLAGCVGDSGASAGRTGDPSNPRTYEMRLPIEGTSEVKESNGIKIDVSNASLGYTIVTSNTGGNNRMKVQIKMGEQAFDFDINNEGSPEVFPLTFGSGNYTISVMENLYDNTYSQLLSHEVSVSLTSEHDPFLVPNQYVNYDGNSSAIAFGYELTKDCGTDLEVVDAVYDYIIGNIQYDDEKALVVNDQPGPAYVPNIDATLAEKKGICFDYSALAAAMLRSHDIPTKLVIGEAYPLITKHAWNEIYIEDVGWVKKELYFDGENWTLADTTLGASRTKEDIQYLDENDY